MKVKEIKKTWKSYSLDRGKTHLLYDKKEMSGQYTPHKYLCDIEKVKSGWYMILTYGNGKHFNPTNDIDILIKNVEDFVSSLPYNSEFYNSQYREGYFEEMVINNYMYKLGFDSHHLSFGMGTGFHLKRKNIYNGDRGEIDIIISGLDCFDDTIKEDVKISLMTGKYSWIETKCKRNCEEIIEQVEGLLKPLLLTNCSSDFKLQNELKVTDIELTMNELVGFSIKSKDFKEELIASLEKTLNELKG